MFITKTTAFVAFLILGAALSAHAQEPLKRGGGTLAHDGPMDDVGPEMQERIWRDIDVSLTGMRSSRIDQSKAMALSVVTFIWPLRAARGYSAPGGSTRFPILSITTTRFPTSCAIFSAARALMTRPAAPIIRAPTSHCRRMAGI